MSYLEYRLSLKNNGKPPKEKVIKPIAFHSKKRAKEQVKYRAIVKEMMEESNLCEIKIIGVCSRVAEGLHHIRKRQGNLLDRTILKRCCNNCNQWIEENSKEAKEMGLTISKFSKQKIS